MKNKTGYFSKHHANANRHQNLVFRENGVYFHQGIQEEFLQETAQEKQGRHSNKKGKIWVNMQIMGHDKGDIHGHHHQLAVSQVNDAHNTHNQRHPDTNETVNTPYKDPGDYRLKEDGHLTFLS